MRVPDRPAATRPARRRSARHDAGDARQRRASRARLQTSPTARSTPADSSSRRGRPRCGTRGRRPHVPQRRQRHLAGSRAPVETTSGIELVRRLVPGSEGLDEVSRSAPHDERQRPRLSPRSQLLQPVLTQGLQDPERSDPPIGDHHGLVDERRHEIDRVVGVASAISALAASRSNGPANTARRSERFPLFVAQQAPAPVDGGTHGGVSFEASPPTRRHHVDVIAQSLSDVGERERARTRGGQLDSERNAVQPATDLADELHVGFERRICGGRLGPRTARPPHCRRPTREPVSPAHPRHPAAHGSW